MNTQEERGWEEEWYEFWCEESQNTEQKYLTPDTHGIIKDFIRSAILKAKEDGMKQAYDKTIETVNQIPRDYLINEYDVVERHNIITALYELSIKLSRKKNKK